MPHPGAAPACRAAPCPPLGRARRAAARPAPRVPRAAPPAAVEAPAAEAPAAAAPAAAQQQRAGAPAVAAQPQREGAAGFEWSKAWYPAAAEEHLDPSKPHRVTLMGKELVLWRDSKGTWHAQNDACPHRLAALSDGFLDAANDQIVCSYHGWRFTAEGKCVDIPQLRGDATAHATACGSGRTCVKSYIVKEKGGLLWVWPDASPTAKADSDAAAIPLPSELEDESLAPLAGRWFVREQPYSFDLFLENVLDPAHVDFAHDGVAGFSAAKHKPLTMQLLQDSGPQGFVYRVIPSKPGARASLLTFAAPSHVSIFEEPAPAAPAPAGAAADAADAGDVRPGSSNPNIRSGLIFYVYPTKPGWSRFHGTSFVCDKEGKPVKSASIFARALPPWLQHTLGHTFLAGDDLHLHNGSKNLARAGFDHLGAYYPVAQDQAVLHMRRWLSEHAGGNPPWPAHLQGAAPILSALDLERPQVLDRYHQHVRHCKHCSAALDNARKTASAAAALAAAAAAAALLSAVLRLAAPALAAAGAQPAALPGWLAAALGALGPAPLLGVAAAALLVRWAGRKLEGQFVGFNDFERKPFAPSAAAQAAAAAAQA
ncbi:MAG: hypothetical protein J3K34DRAFT_522861 [Monoraphidium minutum]|nr:MAG: hypothetical protein J3K34DRAFT_522861 [Monoraphidium minutum]